MMFFVKLYAPYPNNRRVLGYDNLNQAIDSARSEALYGRWWHIEIASKPVNGLLMTFRAQEMRDATRQQREAREVQEFPRVCPSL
jgi:hypothetical protein